MDTNGIAGVLRWPLNPRSLREQLGDANLTAAALPALRSLHNLGRRSLVVLAYHRVMPLPDPATYPFDLDLISASPEAFEQQMRYLREHCNPIALSDVSYVLSGRKSLPERAVAVTFDDGFRDNLEFAAPILRKYAIPATVFVTTSQVGSTVPFWFELATYIAMRSNQSTVQLSCTGERIQLGETLSTRRAAARRIRTAMKNLPFEQISSEIGQLLDAHSSCIQASDFALSSTLTWDDVRSIAESGVSIGSHTVNHSILSRLSTDDLTHELLDSRTVIEAQIQRPVTALAYPVGRRASFNEEVIRRAGRCGYRLAVAHEPGVNWLPRLNPFALLRQNVETSVTPGYFRSLVNLPAWFR